MFFTEKMNNLIAKMAYRIIFVVAFLFAVNHLNAQSTPKVGITQLIGCGTGNNVNKAEVTVSVDESLSGYQYNFEGSWVNTNKAWLTAGNYTVQVKKGTEYYHTLHITVPTKATAPTYNSKIIYNCNGTGNVTLTNDQPTYQHSYTYKGVTKTDPHFSNLTTGVHSISVTYTVPPTTKATIFYDDFGKKTGNVKSVKSPYVNQNIYFDPMNGSKQVRPDGATRNKTTADSYYAIGNRKDMKDGTPSSLWVLPNDKDGDANGRYLWYNVRFDNEPPGEKNTVYKRKVKVTPGLPIEFSAYVYNPVNNAVLPNGYKPDVYLKIFRSEADFKSNTPMSSGKKTIEKEEGGNLNNWTHMRITANAGDSDSELIFVIYMDGGGNDLCVDNILVTQTSKSCPFTQIVPITIEANPNPPTITTQPVASVVYCKNTTIVNALNINATTTTGTLSYRWFENTTNSTTGGNQVATTQTYKPQTTVAGIKYYYAVVSNGCSVATSTVAKVEVLTPPEVTQIIATPPAFKQGESASVEFTIKGTPNAQVTYNINGTGTQVATLNSSGTYTLPSRTVNQTTILNVTKVKLGACEQNYTDKSGGILATTAKCTTKPAPQFATTPPNGQTAVMNGVTVTRTYSNPSKTATLVYGTIDNDGYCSGTPYHNYTIIHTKPNFSPKVIYTFSQPITNAEVWLMVMGSPSTVNDKVKLSTNNGVPTFTKVYDCAEGKGKAGATLSNTGEVTSQDHIITDVAVRVTSNTPFTQLIVEDIHPGSSGVLVELCPASITPAETISITTQPQSQTICADKMATFTSKAQLKDATGNIQYKWQQKSDNGTNWTDIASSDGSIASGGTASLTIAGTTNYKYRVVYSYQFAQGIVVTATSQEATLTKLPPVALPTLITGSKTLCPTATNNTVSFANYVTAPTGTTLLWYTAPTATVSSTTAPVMNTQVTTRTTQTAYVRALSTAGCTSGIVTVTLTVDDTTAPTFTAPTPLNIVCNSTTATTAISNWLGTATATDACGAIATITNNYNAPADLCTVPGGIITVTFVAKDTFGNTKTGTSTIHLGVTPLVVQDDTFNIPNGLATQTTTSVLANDSLGGNTPTAGNGGTVTITNVVPATPINGGNVPVLNPENGVVTIPAKTPAGTYTITYKECETLNPNSNCQTATAVIKVGTPTITVVPDPMTVTPSTTTQTTPSILNNDKIGGTVTPTAGPGGNVTMTVTNPSNPGNKPTLDPNTGKVTIPGNTPAGTYTITYSYCEVLNPTNCTGTQTLVVTVGAATLTVQDDTFNIPNGLATQTTTSVLANDSLGGNTPTAGNGGTVTITNVVPATPINGGNVPVLNPDNGVVTIPAKTPAGTYTITYKECETLNPNSNCQTATAVIKVGTPTITVVPDPMTVTPSTTTQTTPSILNNDKIGGTVTPTAGPGGNVTMTVNNPSNPGNKPTLDPNTGKVTIPGNTPAGNYTITYSYCEVLNPTNCTGTQTLVVTVGAATLTVQDDTFNIPDGLTTQTTISVLDNDSLGGNTPTAGNGGTVTITNVVPATPINGGNVPVLNPDNGVVTIPAKTPAGTYTITYKECEALNPNSNCKTATAVIKVGTPTITVVPDPMTVTPSTTTQTIPSILNNDKIGGTVTPTPGPGGNVTMTVTNPSNPGNKPTLDPNTGEVTIPGNTPAGTYTITYSYCEVLNPTNCTGTQTLVVTVGAATLTVQDDTFNIPDGLATQTTISVLDNDSLGGNTPTAGNGGTVTITNVVPATPINGGNVPVLNPENGVVTIPAKTPAGTYTITYKECETLNPNSNCKTATAVIKVGTPTITVVPDPMTVTPSTTTQTIPSILNNDKIGGTVTPTAGPGGNVTMTVTNPSNPGNKPTLDPNTGKVTIPGNTPAGNYTITYSYCEVLNPTNCTGTQTLVVTVGAATLTVQDDTFNIPNGLATQTTISVLDNDSLGGNTPTAGNGGTVTITNVVPATPINGGNVPVLNPDNGVVTIPAKTPAGTYTITYKECEALNPNSNCKTATAVIKVGTPTITVVPDPMTVTPSTTTQTTPSILNNDKIGGTVTPTPGPGGNVTMTVTNPSNPGNKPTLDPNTGKVTIPGNTPAGNYTITYSYCEVLNPTNCTGTQTLVVTVGAATLTVQDDTFNIPDGLATQTTTSVLANDSLGGNTPTAGNGGTVTITNVVPATPINGGNVPVLNPENGVVTIPAKTPAGTYTITYKECEALNPNSNCKTATAVIKVGTPTITVTPEAFTVTPSTTTQTIPSILNNDKIGGTVTPTPGPGGNVTMTVNNPSNPGNKPTLDPNTGKVTIPGNTPAGNYTITYSYCEVLNPTNCTGTQTLVVTVGAATLTVQDDTFNIPDGLTTQTTISVLDNDSLGGNTPTAGNGGTVTITNVVPATPINGGNVPVLNPDNGVVTIPAKTPAGTYTITYKECEALNPNSNCKTATAVIKVGTPTITVVPDPMTVTPSTTTQTTPSILNNDKIGGTVTPTPGPGGNVTMTVTNPSNPGNKPTLDPNTGEVTIPGNTPAGTYTITYSYCEVLNPTNCTGTQTLVVTVGAATLTVQDDTFNIPDGLATQTTTSVLANDSLGGTKPTAGNGGTVTITNVVPATPINGGNVPVLNPENGVVTIPANTPAGTYTITYKECEALNPNSNCQTATAVIKVGTPTITVVPDPMTVTPSTTTQTTPSILNNDKIGGTVTPTAGPGGNVTMTVTNPSNPGNKPTLDPNTGEVTIPGNTPAGTYTITYSYCEVLNPTNCTGTQTLVVTVGAATLTVVDDTFNIPDGLATQTTTSVLANDSLGGNTPTAGNGGTVTITNVVPATPINGGNVPVLNPENGVVTIPAKTPAGTYTITYKECETLNPNSNCKTATAVIKVGTPTITVVPDPMTVTPSTTTQTIPSILNNDKIGGTVTPTAGPGGNVTMTVNNPSNPGNKPTLDPNTGEVTIPGNTPAGTYTITYSYCEVLNPTNCTGTQTLVVTVVGTATPTPTPVAVDDRVSTALNTSVNIAVLANDTLNGATTPNVVTQPANGTVVVNADNTVEYRPHTGFVGTDTFVYEICNSAGCSSATVTVDIINKLIPYNGMSVNGDGKNDHFHIGGIENYPNNVVRIYNRWGVKVFEVSGYDNVTRVFRGISDGRVTVEAADKLPQGTYYYVIEYYDQNNNKQSEVGWLYIKK
ncbi:3-deoxy-7-phosphoheptulonate synthase [Capnocytophaga ochracea]|uniref:3-deoxy-7-phosphoheptulonate synthase n=2 Tax=Capnocytophaga ochracea TaxID=1018 RepID=A0A2X2SUW5_CAPOC|nr:3-deoxy-7-phosphoheptulonate synthase [Capnocytophaga ochracea]